jgi:hypothetical protein
VVLRTLSQARAWRPAVVARLARTLGVTQNPMPSFISIACDCGGPEARFVGERKVLLYQALSRSVSSTHCSAIDEYALVLYVDGSVAKYGPEGLSRLRFAKVRRYISVDLVVSETRWKSLERSELDALLVEQVKLGLEACCQRLERDRQHVDRTAFMSQVEQGFADFLSHRSSELSPSDA